MMTIMKVIIVVVFLGELRMMMKKSEAKMLIYLQNVTPRLKSPTMISAKLNLDYCYLVRILRVMEAKGWVRGCKSATKTFYNLTSSSPVEKAKELML